MDFKDFLNEHVDIKFVSCDSYGYVTVSINGKKYVYLADAAWAHQVWNKAKYKSGAALNDLKKYARLVEKPS